MGDLNAAKILEEARVSLGGRGTASVPDSRLFRWLTQTVRHIGNPSVYEHDALKKSENITLTAASLYTLATDVVAVRTVTNTTVDKGYGLIVMEQTELDLMTPLTGGARPNFYVSSGDDTNSKTLEVFPSPDTAHQGDVLRVRYWARPAAINTGGDIPVFDAEWDEVLIDGVAFRGWKALGNPIQRDLFGEAYVGAINDIRAKLTIESREQRDRSPNYDHQRYLR